MTLDVNSYVPSVAVRGTIVGTITAGNSILTIHSGTLPTGASALNYDRSTHTGTVLITYTGFTVADNGTLEYIYFPTLPGPTAASATGTATWFALGLTTDDNYGILGDVTDETGNGACRMLTTSIVSATNYEVQAFNVRFRKP